MSPYAPPFGKPYDGGGSACVLRTVENQPDGLLSMTGIKFSKKKGARAAGGGFSFLLPCVNNERLKIYNTTRLE